MTTDSGEVFLDKSKTKNHGDLNFGGIIYRVLPLSINSAAVSTLFVPSIASGLFVPLGLQSIFYISE